MTNALWILTFWTGLVLLFLAYPGYPLVLWLIRKPRAVPPAMVGLPSVAVVLVARNESARIGQRLRNLLECPLPIRDLIVVCDGCTDDTAAVARSMGFPSVRVIEVPESKGKPAGVNLGMASTDAEVVVFCDARQRFDKDTIPHLVRWFSEDSTGAVSGALEIETAESASGRGVDAYWRLEKLIRQMESDMDSSVGCTGAVYAVRRACFQPIPEDTILDDVVVPMQIASQGHRVRFDATALAFDPQSLDGDKEQRRKVRTLAGNFQLIARYPLWMLPTAHRLWWKLILHKYLRLAGPVLIAMTMIASLALSAHRFFAFAAALQGLCVLLAAIGLVTRSKTAKAFAIPAGFLFLQWCVVRGFFYWLGNRQRGGWR